MCDACVMHVCAALHAGVSVSACFPARVLLPLQTSEPPFAAALIRERHLSAARCMQVHLEVEYVA
jgi:hypothetical protein